MNVQRASATADFTRKSVGSPTSVIDDRCWGTALPGSDKVDSPPVSLMVRGLSPSFVRLQSQFMAVQLLRDEVCHTQHVSKLSPAKMQRLEINKPPLFGATVIQEYREASCSDAQNIYEMARRIQGIGIQAGIMGFKEQPMMLQRNVHATIGALILDCASTDDLTERLEELNPTINHVDEILRSEEVASLKLKLAEWKFNSDGNFGIQFDCCESQHHILSLDSLATSLREAPAHLPDTTQAFILKSLKEQGQFDNKTGLITLTRLQKIRLDLALAGAEIKSFWPGTFMVVG